MERNWKDRQYYVQDNADVAHKDVKMYYNTNQFPALTFCGPHSKPRGTRELSKNYHLRFDTKLVNGVCVIIFIPCACVACTSMLDKPWISCISSYKQRRYKTFTKLHLFVSIRSLQQMEHYPIVTEVNPLRCI